MGRPDATARSLGSRKRVPAEDAPSGHPELVVGRSDDDPKHPGGSVRPAIDGCLASLSIRDEVISAIATLQ
jgi:hypothetical protein